MKRLILTLCLLSSYVLAEECHREALTDHYKELGCQPRFENDSKCPTSYDCTSHEQRDVSKCYYQGKSYKISEEFGDLPAACSAACFCEKPEGGNAPYITCANIECPEMFNRRPEPECYHSYTHEDCCSQKTVCLKKDEVAPVRCQHGNATYNEGQRFYPDDAPCMECICMANYNGKIETPFCKEVQCHTQLRSQDRINAGCVPIYYGTQGCCPIDWKCPEDEDRVRDAKTKGSIKTAESCRFGKLVVSPGDSLERGRDTNNVECTCKLPPFLTCIQLPQQ